MWPTKAKYFTWVRGILRAGWNKAPQKIEVLRRKRFMIDNPSPRGKSRIWGGRCEQCGNIFPQSQLQVDHIVEAGKLNDWEDVEGFVKRLLGVTSDDLRLLCKPCHSIITYATRYNLTYEQAYAKKKVIEYMKNHSVAQQKKVLDKHGMDSQNENVRKQNLTLLLEKGSI